ncbi:DNA repair ATPase [Enhygromyxa salina]|uniref:ATPase involved in DNA repair n=1 Tax=Enhygromyxa salina TaxID=215803 RepID=A0A2S9YSU2_9BACT|nr:DNA repair ATPase [Enhygromyxa salina]PRQ08109.1 ATPase involved in DNA repair [Enhygromyxa salina]
MAEDSETGQVGDQAGEDVGGSYDVIRARLVEQARELGTRARALNDKRIETFGGSELTIIGTEHVRTDNNCVPCDVVMVNGRMLFGYNVFLGLRKQTKREDVFSLHNFTTTAEGFDLSPLPGDHEDRAFLDDPQLEAQFHELYEYYKDARLIRLWRSETKLLAIFQIGATHDDIRVFRWSLDAEGRANYIDNRGERDYVFPPQHDFEWRRTGREHHVAGRHPHVSILDEVFVETVGGDLTVKVENNTEDGHGIYAEPVDERGQSLDDAEISYAKVGTLILLSVLPYRETTRRFLVFATRSRKVVRADAIGAACVQLPEDHGVIFPGGYFLQDGSHKVFDGDYANFEFERAIRSPNGEDVLYVFHRRAGGQYALFPYNLIRKEIGSVIPCNGFSVFADGRMAVFRSTTDEPSRMHAMQFWQTPFTSLQFAAEAPSATGPLAKIGNAELVRGISECLSLQRAVDEQEPSRQIYEDLVGALNRALDTFYWFSREDVGNPRAVIDQLRETASLIVDEFDKVVAIRKEAAKALAQAEHEQAELLRAVRPAFFDTIEQFMTALTGLRTRRGHVISLREIRYINRERLDELERELVDSFDRTSAATVEFLLDDKAFDPLSSRLEQLGTKIGALEKTKEVPALETDIEATSEGLNVLSEVIGGLEVDDPTKRTTILERISEVFAQVNRARAMLQNKRRSLMSHEGKAEFVAQFKLFALSVSSGLGMADSPDRCDEQLSRLLVQLEELEAKFSEFDEFLGELATKREEVYEAFTQKKQQLLDERSRRAENMVAAGNRILQGVARRAKSFKSADELNAYFASDPMVLKLRELAGKLVALGDTVKADELDSRAKSARQDALRGLRDRLELFEGGEGGASLVKLGRHRFTVNTQPLELGMVPTEAGMMMTLSGTDFRELVDDEAFAATREYWEQTLVSETPGVYRGEYLAASILFAAERGEQGLSLTSLREAQRADAGLLGLVRRVASERYDEGYERGLHDADAAAILDKLLLLYSGAGLLRFSVEGRVLGLVFWAELEAREHWQISARSLGRLRTEYGDSRATRALARELAAAVEAFYTAREIPISASAAQTAGSYLVEELASEQPRFVVSAAASALHTRFIASIDLRGLRTDLEHDLSSLGPLRSRWNLARAWVDSYLDSQDTDDSAKLVADELVGLLLTPTLDRQESAALLGVEAEGLLGQHPRVKDGKLEIRLDEFLARLEQFGRVRVPGYTAYRRRRQELLERERKRLRIDEFLPRVLSSFVRNKLINEVYLQVIGDNLAKQLGAAGDAKRTDLMGLLLLISPPGYGKTTLMEYIASRFGLVFMKVNGPALGHSVVSLDPSEAPNITARQEVDKINLALEMGNNVMLYLDDIQHTHPELLQKFISLCDAQRRIEGVWKGRTRTYDMRGKKFCVVMAGNPYTESGEKFQIPDMLANRADTYDLGDTLTGSAEAFALSYIENAITSNATLAPLATREQADIYKLIRMAQGHDTPTTELSHDYSGVELGEIKKTFAHLLRVQEVLLKVNQEYIRSASMDDRYRTEPPFKLQGSYRNMAKLAEKVVPAMNEAELQALIEDHYAGEARTLTSGAEQNTLKLAELRGVLSDAQRARWDEIRRGFVKAKNLGGAEDDPTTRVTRQLSNLAEQLVGIQGTLADKGYGVQLDGIRSALDQAARLLDAQAKTAELERKKSALAAPVFAPKPAIAPPPLSPTSSPDLVKLLERLGNPKIEITVPPPAGIEELLGQQVQIIERTLVPLVRTATKKLEDRVALEAKLDEVISALESMDLRMKQGLAPVGPRGGG